MQDSLVRRSPSPLPFRLVGRNKLLPSLTDSQKASVAVQIDPQGLQRVRQMCDDGGTGIYPARDEAMIVLLSVCRT
jgi:hypothetical protein